MNAEQRMQIIMEHLREAKSGMGDLLEVFSTNDMVGEVLMKIEFENIEEICQEFARTMNLENN